MSVPQLGLQPVQPVGSPGSYDPAEQTGSLFNAFVVRKITSACSSEAACNDNNPCTTDACQQGVCVNTPAAGCCQSAAQCDDADPCNACSGNACQHSPVTGCCQSASQCDDGTACTADTCDANVCQHKALPACCAKNSDCADTNACTTDTCESSTGTCLNESSVGGCSADTDCADDDPCTLDTCGSCACAHVDIDNCKPTSVDAGGGTPSDASVSSDASVLSEAGAADGSAPEAPPRRVNRLRLRMQHALKSWPFARDSGARGVHLRRAASAKCRAWSMTIARHRRQVRTFFVISNQRLRG